jgi:hypothetical protein
MVERDSLGVYACPSCDNSWKIGPTDHLREERWPERSHDTERSSVEAWDDAIEFVGAGTRLSADEIRYSHETRTVILRKDTSLVTAIDVVTARFAIQLACVRSLVRMGDCNSQIARLCQDCDIGRQELTGVVELERKSGKKDTPVTRAISDITAGSDESLSNNGLLGDDGG